MRLDISTTARFALALLVGFLAGHFWREDNPSKNTGEDREARNFSNPTWHKPTQRFSGIARPELGLRKNLQNRSNLLARANITKEDIEDTKAMYARQAQGEFILNNEAPFLKKVRDYDFQRIAGQTASNNSAEYERLFEGFALDQKVNAQLQTHIAKIHKASLETELAIGQAKEARMAFDKRVRSLLTDEDYQAFRQYEAMKPAKYELEQLQKFAEETLKQSIPADVARVIVDGIHQSGAIEPGWWYGPYDSLPDIKMGIEEVKSWGELRDQQDEQSANQLLQRLAEMGVSAGDLDIVQNYYELKIQRRKDELSALTQKGRSGRGPFR